MTKVFAVLALAIGASGLISAQQAAPGQAQPDFSGNWTLVEDRSAPGTRALGKDFKVTQTPTTVIIETTATVFSSRPGVAGAPMTTERSEVKVPSEYICDGAEHELVVQIPGMPSMPNAANMPPGAVASLPPQVMYRATWMSGQLIITRQSKSPLGNEKGALTGVTRLALSFDADGSLVVDNLTVTMMPRPNGPKQEPPMSIRSVYKKAP